MRGSGNDTLPDVFDQVFDDCKDTIDGDTPI